MPDYPEKAHPPLGICVMILVILNVSSLYSLLFSALTLTVIIIVNKQ